MLVEGGGQVHRSFLEARLVDRVELFLAPRLLAGGPGWVSGPGWSLAEGPQLQLLHTEALGADLHLTLGIP